MKSPAFQFYVQDFIMGTLSFSAEEIGAYILLLCHQWDKGFILESEVESVSRIGKDKLKKVLRKFEIKRGRVSNKRLEIVRAKQLEYAKTQSGKGKAGAEARWHRPSSGHASANANALLKNGSSSSTSSSTSEIQKDNTAARKKNVSEQLLIEMFTRGLPMGYDSEKIIRIVAEFRNKYPDKPANQSGALVNGWCRKIMSPDVKSEIVV